MFPYRDDNPTLRTPFVTVGIIAVTAIVWVVVQGAGAEPALAKSVCELGAIPGELLGKLPETVRVPLGGGLSCEVGSHPTWYTVLTAIFMHGSWFHLIGNMWFLWIFGNNVEDSMGHARFAAFYVICGVLAALAQILASPGSPIPMVGASGAISGIMGAYLVLYPKVRVHMLIFLGFWVTTVAVPAYLMLIYWMALQVIGGLPVVGGGQETGGVAFLAHVGGFVAGAVLIKAFVRSDRIEAQRRAIAGPGFNAPWRRGAGWEEDHLSRAGDRTVGRDREAGHALRAVASVDPAGGCRRSGSRGSHRGSGSDWAGLGRAVLLHHGARGLAYAVGALRRRQCRNRRRRGFGRKRP